MGGSQAEPSCEGPTKGPARVPNSGLSHRAGGPRAAPSRGRVPFGSPCRSMPELDTRKSAPVAGVLVRKRVALELPGGSPHKLRRRTNSEPVSEQMSQGASLRTPCRPRGTRRLASCSPEIARSPFSGLGRSASTLPPRDRLPGVVVLTEFETQQWALRLIREVVSSESGLLIVVVVLDSLSSNAGKAEVDLMLEVQRRFQDAGADDVVVKGTGSEEQLRLSVLMGIQRAQRRGKDHEAINQIIEQQDEKAVSSANMFWSCVHRIFAGFPKIDPHAPEISQSMEIPGQMVGNTRLSKVLGEGAFGCVYSGKNQESGETEAVKVVSKTSLFKLHKVCTIWREFSLLAKLRHPNIVRLLSVTHTPHSVAIHMELVGRMSLHSHIKELGGALQMPVLYEIAAQIASALAHCHSLGIAHRDVKHENIVIADSASEQQPATRAKLVDFGPPLGEPT